MERKKEKEREGEKRRRLRRSRGRMDANAQTWVCGHARTLPHTRTSGDAHMDTTRKSLSKTDIREHKQEDALSLSSLSLYVYASLTCHEMTGHVCGLHTLTETDRALLLVQKGDAMAENSPI